MQRFRYPGVDMGRGDGGMVVVEERECEGKKNGLE
jgi:hypothetical protein